jgi:hypothetical protein
LLNNNAIQLLFIMRAANMQLTSDQTFAKLFNGTLWDPFFVIANRTSGAFSSACAGGIYTAPAKGGTAIVAAAQSFSTLTGENTQTICTVLATTTTFSGTPILSLTTGNAAGLLADIYIYGACYDQS